MLWMHQGCVRGEFGVLASSVVYEGCVTGEIGVLQGASGVRQGVNYGVPGTT
jgi:hypothetical protein